jgi:hypothetical protein
MTQTTQTTATTTVVAEDAPIGVLLWPVRATKYNPNMTLRSVEIVRTATQRYVRWTYENDNTRSFRVGEEVAIWAEARS